MHWAIFGRPSTRPKFEALQQAWRFPALGLSLLGPLALGGLLGEIHQQNFLLRLLQGAGIWLGALGVTETWCLGMQSLLSPRKVHQSRIMLMGLGSTAALGVAFCGLDLDQFFQVFLPALVLSGSTFVLYIAYLKIGRTYSPNSFVTLAIQSSRIWLPLALVAILIHYVLYQVDRHAGPKEYKHLILTVLLTALGVAGEFAVSLFFSARIRRGWEDGEWYRDLTRALLCATLAWLFYCHFTATNPMEIVAQSAFFSVTLGFILRPTLGNFVVGLIMRLAPPYSLGDFVQIGSHIGMVYAIDWRSTSLKLANGDLRIFPSSYVARHSLTNFSQPTKIHAHEIKIGVEPTIPPHQVRQLLLECASQTSQVKEEPAPEVFLAELGGKDGMSDYRLRYWMDSFFSQFYSESDLHSQILYRFNREGITIFLTTMQIYDSQQKNLRPQIEVIP